MVLYQAKDYKDMSRKAANIISAQVIMKPNAVLGLATGSTPVGAYEQLVEWYNKGDIDFSQVTSVNLDEYKGLSGDNDQSYRYFMNKNLFDHVNIDKARTFVPDGTEPDSKVACAKYNAIIDSVGGIDLQLLGIGGNGHIGFNEPGSAFESLTHCVALKEDTSKQTQDFLKLWMMCRNMHTPWVSRTSCQPRKFCCWQAERTKQRQFMNPSSDRSYLAYRLLYCSFTTM